MALMEVPLGGDGRLLVVASDDETSPLELAALRPGEVALHARQSLEHVVQQIGPVVEAFRCALASSRPDEMALEFGVLLGAETGLIVAKGNSEVHFTITATWKKGNEDGAAT